MEKVRRQHVLSLNTQKLDILYMVVSSLLVNRKNIKYNKLFQLSVKKMKSQKKLITEKQVLRP